MFRCRTRVHESLGHHGQTCIRDAVFMDVKHKLGVLDDIHPEPQRKTEGRRENALGFSKLPLNVNMEQECNFKKNDLHYYTI